MGASGGTALRRVSQESNSSLKHALEAYGNEKMVKVYLASGHASLSQAARIWAHDHGMALVSGPDTEPEAGIWAGG